MDAFVCIHESDLVDKEELSTAKKSPEELRAHCCINPAKYHSFSKWHL